jgi:hypothetical protein
MVGVGSRPRLTRLARGVSRAPAVALPMVALLLWALQAGVSAQGAPTKLITLGQCTPTQVFDSRFVARRDHVRCGRYRLGAGGWVVVGSCG